MRTIAIDTLNADFTGGEEFPIHDMFADAGGFIAENLAGTAALTPGVEPLLLLLAAEPGGLRRRPDPRRGAGAGGRAERRRAALAGAAPPAVRAAGIMDGALAHPRR